jgi:lipopolysaccharide export system protein LptA
MNHVFVLLLLASLAVLTAHAERADRLKPITIQADQAGQIDLQRQLVVFTGNVVVSKGTMVMHAARIEVRQTPKGYDTAVAFGAPGKLATFRQKRDNVDEYIDGQAERLEYDGKTDTVKFIKNAMVRRLRGTTTADEITGSLITYESGNDVLRVSGGAASTPTNPSGRVRVVLTPVDTTETPKTTAPELKLTPKLGATAASSAKAQKAPVGDSP